MQRKKTKGLPIHKRKLFAKNSDMIFEQDFAQPHFTNASQEFMEEHFPAHTPTLWRYENSDPLFFGSKRDDFWFIERLWGIHSQRVYRNPRPTHISGVMRRLLEEVRNTDHKTLIRLVHNLPAKMNEIYLLKEGRFQEISILVRAHLPANAPCVNLEIAHFFISVVL